MATKTFSLSEDASERLKAMKREGESSNDAVGRLTAGAKLTEFHGALSERTAGELEARVAKRRTDHSERRGERLAEIEESMNS